MGFDTLTEAAKVLPTVDGKRPAFDAASAGGVIRGVPRPRFRPGGVEEHRADGYTPGRRVPLGCGLRKTAI